VADLVRNGTENAVSVDEAKAQFSAGRFAQAEALCRQILAVDSRQPEALHLLGMIALSAGQRAEAEKVIRRATDAAPLRSDFWCNLGLVLVEMEEYEEAVKVLRTAVQLRPDFPQAHNNLGVALEKAGRCTEAIDALTRATQLQDRYPDAYCNLGNALLGAGRCDDAISAFARALAQREKFPEASANLANALRAKGDIVGAEAAVRQALAWNPSYAEAYDSLGTLLQESGRIDSAIDAFKKAISLRPDFAQAMCNLGNALHAAGRPDEAVAAMEKALLLKPDYVEAHNNLFVIYFHTGRLEAALGSIRQAQRLRPQSAVISSNLLFSLHFAPRLTPEMIFQEHLQWDRRHAEPLRTEIVAHNNHTDMERRLRVGYVSPDFHGHPVAYFFQNLLAAHDPQAVETFCYNNSVSTDATTRHLMRSAHHWRDIHGASDDAAAEMIRNDGIDILIDLAGHTSLNRLLVFARKPAPVQVTYLGYPDTTGMYAMDYRLTDALADPPGRTQAYHSEKLIRLPGAFASFRPFDITSAVAPAPALKNGFATFGCFTSSPKINPILLENWAAILQRSPRSRLILVAREMADREVRERYLAPFSAKGITSERVNFLGWHSAEEYLRRHGEIDLLLDTFPVNGHTNSCHGLWMGVPLISLAGRTHCQRLGVSVLANLGLPELIAASPVEYIQLAVDLAGDPDRLRTLRSGMRERLRYSPIMNATQLARNIESAYRRMWRTWCGSAA
jgi:protein O-GlcNAc transferase